MYVAAYTGVNAYAVQDGAAVWSHQEPGFSPSSPPAVSGGGVYLSGADGSGVEHGRHLALDPATGRRRWVIDGSQTEAPPLVVDDVVVQGRRGSDGLAGYDSATGATIWNDTTAWAWPRPVGEQGVVFHQSAGNLVARRTTTGAVLWQWPIPHSTVESSSRWRARMRTR